MYIYLITNLITSKRYIGQTVQKPQDRWRNHINGKDGTPIQLSIQKYGKQNFLFEIIDYAETLEELNKKETAWIYKVGSLTPEGYNLNLGGGNRIQLEGTRRQISKTLLGRNLTEDHKKKISLGNKNKKRDSRTKNKISKTMTGIAKPQISGIKNGSAKLTEEDVIFIRNSNLKQKDLAELFNVNSGLISGIIKRKYWKYLP